MCSTANNVSVVVMECIIQKKANNWDHVRMYIHVMLDEGIWLMCAIFTLPSGHNEDDSS